MKMRYMGNKAGMWRRGAIVDAQSDSNMTFPLRKHERFFFLQY